MTDTPYTRAQLPSRASLRCLAVQESRATDATFLRAAAFALQTASPTLAALDNQNWMIRCRRCEAVEGERGPLFRGRRESITFPNPHRRLAPDVTPHDSGIQPPSSKAIAPRWKAIYQGEAQG